MSAPGHNTVQNSDRPNVQKPRAHDQDIRSTLTDESTSLCHHGQWEPGPEFCIQHVLVAPEKTRNRKGPADVKYQLKGPETWSTTSSYRIESVNTATGQPASRNVLVRNSSTSCSPALMAAWLSLALGRGTIRDSPPVPTAANVPQP